MRFPRMPLPRIVILVMMAIPSGLSAANRTPSCPENGLVVCDDVEDPKTLNPVHEFTARNHTIVQQIFDGLLIFDEAGKLCPCIASSWCRITPTRWRFKLRTDVTFHDDRPLGPEDVAFSIRTYLDPRSAFPARDYFSSILDAKVIDHDTVDVMTRRPDGLLEHKLAFLRILPKAAYEKAGPSGFDRHPIGTGPFRFDRWEHGSAIHLSRFDRHFLSPPKVRRLTFRFIPLSEQVSALLDGKVDLLTDVPGTNTFRIKKHRGIALRKKYCYFTYPGSLATTRRPFNDIRARLALQLAINRDHLIRYEARGNGRILATTSMQGQCGFNPSLKPYPFDPAKAANLFHQVFGDSPPIIHALVKSQATRIGNFIRASLARVGVEMIIHSTNDADQFKRLASQPWDLFLGSCPDPFCHVSFIQSIGTHSKGPFSLVRDPRYDELFQKAVQTLDPCLHQSAFRQLDAYVHAQCLNVFTYQKMKIYAYHEGLRFTPYVSGMPYFRKAHWFDEKTSQTR